MADEIRYEVKDAIATLTIDREPVRNAVSTATLRELREKVERAGQDPEVRVIVLTGAGERAFCAGADMGADGAFADPRSYQGYLARAGFPDLFRAMHECPRPIIGKVRGYCLAGGLGLALACDLIVAGESATFGTPEVERGLFPMMIFAEIVRNLGFKRALELVLIGDRLSARQAHEQGWVNRVVPDAQLDTEVDAFATRLAGYSPAVLGLGKRACYTAVDMTFEQALAFLRSQITINLLTEDTAEGLAAFREKRSPKFTGR
jgi:enoyl-CoA hydratase/carnithine racemase